MELITYLNQSFLTKDELLEKAKVSAEKFDGYQRLGVMPGCSYKLNMNLSSDSFFGIHHEKHIIEYYPHGYLSWLGILQSTPDKDAAFAVFARRYEDTICKLRKQGHRCENPKVNEALANHIKEEWAYFIDGIYGLCTKSGLPEDIATKEWAILQIKELIENEDLDDTQRIRLERAVNLLDSASSLFAPHEREKSSRHRLIDEVRRKYRLPVSAFI